MERFTSRTSTLTPLPSFLSATNTIQYQSNRRWRSHPPSLRPQYRSTLRNTNATNDGAVIHHPCASNTNQYRNKQRWRNHPPPLLPTSTFLPSTRRGRGRRGGRRGKRPRAEPAVTDASARVRARGRESTGGVEHGRYLVRCCCCCRRRRLIWFDFL